MMKKVLKRNFIAAIFLLLSGQLHSQPNISTVTTPITLQHYLSNVIKGNLGYIAEQLNVNIAEATYKASKVFPDPEISLAYSDNEDKTLQMGKSIEAGISYPVSLGNRRRATIALAMTQSELANAMLIAYMQELKAKASASFFLALKEQNNVQLETDIYYRLRELAKADSLRFKTGEIMEIDALQSSLEAQSHFNNIIQSNTDLNNALLVLSQLQGKNTSDTLFIPYGNYPISNDTIRLTDLIDHALKNRGELQIAIKNREISERNMRLLKANRALEFSVEAGYAHNSLVRNETAPAPAHNSYSAGITIPFKFSAINRADIHAAVYSVSQSDAALLEANLQIVSEVTQAYNAFLSLQKQLEQYDQGLIETAEKILDGRTYSYQRGECGLIDVLNAQRTYIDLRKDYNETLYQYTLALIELQRSSATEVY